MWFCSQTDLHKVLEIRNFFFLNEHYLSTHIFFRFIACIWGLFKFLTQGVQIFFLIHSFFCKVFIALFSLFSIVTFSNFVKVMLFPNGFPKSFGNRKFSFSFKNININAYFFRFITLHKYVGCLSFWHKVFNFSCNS